MPDGNTIPSLIADRLILVKNIQIFITSGACPDDLLDQLEYHQLVMIEDILS